MSLLTNEKPKSICTTEDHAGPSPKPMKTFKDFLINEVRYEGGIDVKVDRSGRISTPNVITNQVGMTSRDSKSEATASAEMSKHVNQSSRNPVASATTLSAAERKRAEERKKRRSLGDRLTSIVKKMF